MGDGGMGGGGGGGGWYVDVKDTEQFNQGDGWMNNSKPR